MRTFQGVGIFAILMLVLGSCQTYEIGLESFKVQMAEATFSRQKDSVTHSWDSIQYLHNSVDMLFVENKNGEKLFVDIHPELQIRTTLKNGTRHSFYFDTILIIDDTLQGGKSRVFTGLRKEIPIADISRVEIQRKRINKENNF